MKTIIIITFIILNIILIARIKYERKIFENRQTNAILQENEIGHSLFKNYKYEYQDLYINSIPKESLDTIIETEYKLFFKIPISYCDACIRPMLNELKLITEKIDKNKIIIITSFPTEHETNNFINDMGIYNLNILNLPDNDFTLDNKELIGAYLFLLNNDLKANKVFFCSKFNTFCNQFYLKAITPYLK